MRSAWNITVFASIVANDVRNVDLGASSFYFDGTFTVAWRDDSLCYGPFAPGYVRREKTKDDDAYFPYGLGRPYVDGDAYVPPNDDRASIYSWSNAVGLPGPAIEIYASELLETSTPQLAYVVRTSVPPFVRQCSNSSSNSSSSSDSSDSSDSSSSDSASVPRPPCFVVGSTSVSGHFAMEQDLHSFPTDSQTISLSLANSLYPASDMRFVDCSPAPDVEVEGFVVGEKGGTQKGDEATNSFEFDASESFSGHSGVALTLQLSRNPSLYIQRFLVPLLFIHTMLNVAYAMSLDDSARNGYADYVFSITTSFVFVYAQTLPPVPYQTRFDWFFTLCYVHCFVHHLLNTAVVVRWSRFAIAFGKEKKRERDVMNKERDKNKQRGERENIGGGRGEEKDERKKHNESRGTTTATRGVRGRVELGKISELERMSELGRTSELGEDARRTTEEEERKVRWTTRNLALQHRRSSIGRRISVIEQLSFGRVMEVMPDLKYDVVTTTVLMALYAIFTAIIFLV